MKSRHEEIGVIFTPVGPDINRTLLLAKAAPKVAAPGLWKGLSPYTSDRDSAETNHEIEQLFTGFNDASTT